MERKEGADKMLELDCLGDMCPVPVMKLQECARMQKPGDSVKLITDHSCTVESVTGFCQKHQLLLSVVEPINGVWELTVTKPAEEMLTASAAFYARYRAEDEEAQMAQCLHGALASDGEFANKAMRLYASEVGCEQILFTPSCSAALELGIKTLGVRAGDEVIMPSYNFPSAANAVLASGAVPVFCDVDAATQNISPESLQAAITPRTVGIVPVHYAGVAADMKKLLHIAQKAKLWVMEDAAQCVGATYQTQPLGTLGDMGAVSFHSTKNITCGEGGALLLRDEALWQRARVLRMHGTDRALFLHGERDRYTWQDAGGCAILSEPCACLLYSQLSHLSEICAARLCVANAYHTALRPLEERGLLRRMHIPEYAGYNGHLYYIILNSEETRDALMQALCGMGIDAKTHYVPLHASPLGARLGYREDSLPNSLAAYRTLLRLPIHTHITAQAATRIAEKIAAFFSV